MDPKSTLLSDADLARQTRAGSMQAFEELVSRYEHRLYAFVAQRLADSMDAREVTQDAFVKAYQAIAQFDTSRAFAPWLFAIARRKCVDRQRAVLLLSQEPMPELIDLNTPHEVLADTEERAALWSLARQRLTRLQYDALYLRYAEEMDVADIARVLCKSRIHVKVLLYRARQTLSVHLKRPDRPVPRPWNSAEPARSTDAAMNPPPSGTALVSLTSRNESI